MENANLLLTFINIIEVAWMQISGVKWNLELEIVIFTFWDGIYVEIMRMLTGPFIYLYIIEYWYKYYFIFSDTLQSISTDEMRKWFILTYNRMFEIIKVSTIWQFWSWWSEAS